MRSSVILPLAAVVLLAVAGCSAAPAPSASAPPAESGSGASATPDATGPSPFPSCDEVTDALSGLVGGLAYDAALSEAQTAPEAYAQRVCVYATTDGGAQIGVTFAAIPFQQTELDSYRTLPGSIDDDRLAEHGAVLQVFDADDAADGHLDSALYLFDEQVSITVQGYAAGGASTAESLPGLTVEAATEAAFAARALVP